MTLVPALASRPAARAARPGRRGPRRHHPRRGHPRAQGAGGGLGCSPVRPRPGHHRLHPARRTPVVRRRGPATSEPHQGEPLKICVLVKVPDPAVPKRMDPATEPPRHSGETNLNPSTPTRWRPQPRLRGRRPPGGRGLALRWVESAERVLRKAVSLGADRAVLLTDPALVGSCVAATGYALAEVLRRGADPDPAGPAIRGQRVLHDGLHRRGAPAHALAHPGDQARRGGRGAALRAPGRVRLRHRGHPACPP